jgi:hypothetical protein
MSVPRFGCWEGFENGFAFVGQPPVISDSFNRKEWAIVWSIYTFSPASQFKAVKRCAMNTAAN